MTEPDEKPDLPGNCRNYRCDERAEARRQQILEAAAHCFRAHGFHGASMQLIARTAGMGVGHIYHYFENKEAIIEAIVAADEQVTQSRFDGFRREPDVFRTMIDQANHGLDRSLNVDRSALIMEIIAESGRNPRIAALVHASDDKKRAQLLELLARIPVAGAAADDEAVLARHRAAQAELIAAIFDGLHVRAMRHPGIDRDAVLGLLRPVLQRILEG